MTLLNLNPLPGKSGAIFEILETRFAKGHYKFGEMISPVELAEEFSVSLQPLRMALNQLRALGFIIITPQVGCKVISPTAEEVQDFFRLFASMESVMAALAADRHDLPEIKRLEALNHQLENCIIQEKGVAEEYSDLVGLWHSTLRSMAKSPSLSSRLKPVWAMSDFMLWQGAPEVPSKSLHTANAERTAITELIAARAAGKAEALMHAHVYNKPLRVGILGALG